MMKQTTRGLGLLMAGVLLMSAPAGAQDRAPGTVADAPLVIFIQEGSSIPAQALVSVAAGPTGIAFYQLSGGGTLTGGDPRMATTAFRGGLVLTPEIVATQAGDDGYLTVVIDGERLARNIRVATVSAANLREIRSLAGLSDTDRRQPAGPLLGGIGGSDQARPSGITGSDQQRPSGIVGTGKPLAVGAPAALSVSDTYLVVDTAGLDRSGWSDEGMVVSVKGRSGVEPGGPIAQGFCIRSPFGPGWIEWQGINPGASLYSVLPESSGSLIWGFAPSQNADAVYNRFWGCNTAIKIPDHCTYYAWDNLCCCNIAASQFAGVCRLADFNGPEAGWPRCPL